MNYVFPSKLDFSNLFLELFKIQDYLKSRYFEVNTTWEPNRNNDRMIISSRSDFNLFKFQIVRSNWDLYREFTLIDTRGSHHYRIDPHTGAPIRIDKVNLLSNLWSGVGSPIQGTLEFALEIYNILADLERKITRSDSEHWHEQTKKI